MKYRSQTHKIHFKIYNQFLIVFKAIIIRFLSMLTIAIDLRGLTC